MYFPRNIDKNLVDWVNSSRRCPLILRGGRQVGKSAAVNALGRQFANLATADFEADPRLHDVFARNLAPRDLVSDLEVLLETRILPGKTLLFLDEVQACPRAIVALRYFKEKLPDLHVIAAGSLLEFALGDISFPVGRVQYLSVYPLCFDEFLVATGRSVLQERRPRGCLPNQSWQVSPATSQALEQALREYLVIGGMPDAVVAYVETRSYLEVQKVHDRLIQAYRDDIPKYAKGDLQQRNVAKVFTQLATVVGQQITYSKLFADDAKRNKASIFLLEKAMLVNLVQSTSPAGLPLAASADETVFKTIFIDIGLMQRICGRSAVQMAQTQDLVASFQGQVAEQYVGQELLASGFGSENGRLFYWRRAAKSSSAEVDFLIVRDQQIVPVEVKSGAGGRLRSLHQLMQTFPALAVALCLQDVRVASTLDKLHFLPLFASLG